MIELNEKYTVVYTPLPDFKGLYKSRTARHHELLRQDNLHVQQIPDSYPINILGSNYFKNVQPMDCLVLFVSSTSCIDNTLAHTCLPWWLADPPSPGRVVDSTPPKHQLPAGSKTNLQRGSQGSQQLIFFWTVNRNLKYRDAGIQAWRILSLPVCVEVTLLIMPQKPVCLFWSSPRWYICLLVMAILERQKEPLILLFGEKKMVWRLRGGGNN